MARILSPTGQNIGNEFLINQFTNYNQRTPSVAALKNGGFVVAWVSEQERTLAPNLGNNTTYSASTALVNPSVDIYARLYPAAARRREMNFLSNTDSNPCANPSVAAGVGRRFHDGVDCARHGKSAATAWMFTPARFPAQGSAARCCV